MTVITPCTAVHDLAPKSTRLFGDFDTISIVFKLVIAKCSAPPKNVVASVLDVTTLYFIDDSPQREVRLARTTTNPGKELGLTRRMLLQVI